MVTDRPGLNTTFMHTCKRFMRWNTIIKECKDLVQDSFGNLAKKLIFLNDFNILTYTVTSVSMTNLRHKVKDFFIKLM